jgi:hypothetical protein
MEVLVHETKVRADAEARGVPERKLPAVSDLATDADAVLATDPLCRRVRGRPKQKTLAGMRAHVRRAPALCVCRFTCSGSWS